MCSNFWFCASIQINTPIHYIRSPLCLPCPVAHSTKAFEFIMITSPNGKNIFRVTGPLCGEFPGHRWIPRAKASDEELWYFYLICTLINAWVNNREAGDLRRHRAHFDVILMVIQILYRAILCQNIWSYLDRWFPHISRELNSQGFCDLNINVVVKSIFYKISIMSSWFLFEMGQSMFLLVHPLIRATHNNDKQ